ncbi:DUF3489 domain-containing protein [Castellaniella hirudinis]|uniref:DUF3489 domain-containing protein n=1 Tax=Castellaniella hirudinis TaxID=1144617 RepID=UPI0039C23B98
MNSKLTPTQHAVLAHAINFGGGKIDWFPDNIKGGARQKVLASLAARDIICPTENRWIITEAGYVALGCAPTQGAQTAALQPLRKTTKQEMVIALLCRPEGVTIAQIMDATGWQAHTVRGTFAGALRKRGITVVSEKQQGQDRVYRSA